MLRWSQHVGACVCMFVSMRVVLKCECVKRKQAACDTSLFQNALQDVSSSQPTITQNKKGDFTLLSNFSLLC